MPKAGDDPSERLLKGEEWEKTGVFAPQNRKKLGICAGLTVVIGAAAAFVVVMDPFGSPDVPTPEPSSPLAFAGGFYVDPNHNAPGTLNGTRMMAVQFKEKPPEPSHFRGNPCCKEVRDNRGLIRRRNAALQVAEQAINDTKDALDDQILAAEQPIYELNLAFNNSRDDLADATENYNTACDRRENADQDYNRLDNECRQPQPPPNCEADKQAALRAANTANETAVATKADMDRKQRLNNEDKERLDAAKQHLLDVEDVRDDDVKFCEEDRIKLDNEMKVVGSDDGVNFWTLSGMVKSEMTRSLYVDFKPKGGPFNFNGTYADDGDIVWQDENRWQKRKVLKAETLYNSDSIGGLYLEPELAEPGTLKGMRMIAEVAESTTLTVVGTDDGVNFWTIHGTKGARSGTATGVTMDFSQAGGTGSTERLTIDGLPDTHRDGSFSDGKIEFTWVPTCDTVLRGEIKWIKQRALP